MSNHVEYFLYLKDKDLLHLFCHCVFLNLKAMPDYELKMLSFFFYLKYINSFIHYYAKQELNEDS